MVWEEVASLRHSHPPSGSGDNKGGSHPTPGTMVMHKLAARLCSADISYALEASLSVGDKANGG